MDFGVVHRDLKPENLFFAREGGDPGRTRVKVLDFGLARLVDSRAITTYGLALGTPSFMSPEQAAGRIDEIDGRADLFALAATGFRLRAGRRIHEADSPAELVTMMSRLPAPRIGTIVPDVSAGYARIIDRALEFNREDRYESAAAMREDVQRALAELDAVARPARLSPAAPPASSPRRSAKVQPSAAPSEPTIDLSESDLERPPAGGTDESLRIPKRRSILPWVALLLVSATAVAFWRDEARRESVLDAINGWGTSLLGPAPSSAVRPGVNAGPDPPARGTGDAGAARSTTRTTATPSGIATHRPIPTKAGTSSAQTPPSPPPGGDR